MARISSAFGNAALNAGLALATDHALCSADPGTNPPSANEISGGTYARVAVSWSTASAFSSANVSSLVTNVPTSTTVAYFSEWSAITAGVAEVGGQLSASVTFSTAGTFTIAASALTVTDS